MWTDRTAEPRWKTALRRIIVITDLDGTLLSAKTYTFEPAGPALELIARNAIPLVLCSSKTRAELEVWRKRLDNHHPFIVENGGGIFIPEGYFPCPQDCETRDGYHIISLGIPYDDVRDRFIRLRNDLGIRVRGFGDMTADEIAELTGLSLSESMLAKGRDFGEPFIFIGSPDERFLKAIEASGLHWTRGRFYHIMGDHDKGKAVRILKNHFDRWLGPAVTIGLGDSLNDLPLLRMVDHPVLIRQENGNYDERITIPGLDRTQNTGPSGWNEAIQRLLADDTA